MRLIVILGMLCTNLFGQQVTTQWVYPIQSSQESSIDGIAIDDQGNVYYIGTFSGSVDFNPGIGAYFLNGGGSNIFLKKFSPSGNFLWARRLSGMGTAFGNSVTVGEDGYIYITGGFEGTLTCIDGTNQNTQVADENLDIFVAKYTSEGSSIWLKRFGGNGVDNAQAITTDNEGGVYITGRFTHTCNFNPEGTQSNRTAVGFHDAFILKINSAGDFEWVNAMGGITFETGTDILVDGTGVYTTGLFTSEIVFGQFQANSSNGGRDVFITKHSFDGDLLWASNLGGASSDDGNCLSSDSHGNIFIGGLISGDVDMDPGPGIEIYDGSFNVIPFIVKLDSLGNYLSYIALDYIDGINGAQTAYMNDICHDDDDNIYAVGGFFGTYDFDPSSAGTQMMTSEGNRDAFVLKFDAENNLDWAIQYASEFETPGCYPSEIEYSSGGVLYQAGSYNGTVDFDPSPNSLVLQSINVNEGYFTMMKDCDVITDTVEVSNCTSVITGSGTEYNESGFYTEWHSSIFGCDSLVTYDVLILGNEFHQNESACDSFYWDETDTDYIFSGDYIQEYVNIHGCDSIFNLHLSISESNETYITATECSGFVLAGTGEVVEQSGTYTDSFFNQAGCDSLVQYELKIQDVVYQVTNNDPDLSVISPESTFQWYSCDPLTLIPSATNPEFTPVFNGTYAVEINQNECSEISECMRILNAELDLQSAIVLFPSPNIGDKFQINMGRHYDQVEIEIFNMHGQLVLAKNNLSGKEIQIGVPTLPNGVYSILIKTSTGQTAVMKFVLA